MRQDCTLAKIAVLTWRYLYLLKMRINTANLSYDQKCSPFSDLTNISHDLKLLSLVQRLRHVHHSRSRPISYTFLVADYWSTTATRSYKQLCQFGEVRTYLLPCYTAAHSTHPQPFWWQQHFFRRPTNVPKCFVCMVSLAPKQLWYSALQVGCQTLTSRVVW